MDYKLFNFHSVVDWCDLDVKTLAPTQAVHLHKAAGGAFSHVHGVDLLTGEKYPDALKNTTTSRFVVRIQAPERLSVLLAALDSIRDRIDPSAQVLVRGMEIAVDAYLNDSQVDVARSLAPMAAHFLKGVNRVSASAPRLYRRKHETRAISSHAELVEALLGGFQVGIGNGHDDRYQHIYLKAQDAGVDLPVEKWRARIEIRLQGDACPVKSIDELRGFEFANLARYFRFKQLESRSPLLNSLADRQICVGGVLDQSGNLVPINRKEGGTRLNKRGTKTSPLSNISRQALRSLSKRWARPGRSAEGQVSEVACGNVGHFGGVDEGVAGACVVQ